MSDKKQLLVFDKETFDTKVIGWIERRTYVTSDNLISLLEGLSTTITLDDKIEKRAKATPVTTNPYEPFHGLAYSTVGNVKD